MKKLFTLLRTLPLSKTNSPRLRHPSLLNTEVRTFEQSIYEHSNKLLINFHSSFDCSIVRLFSIRCCREFLPLLLSILFIAACGIANAQYTKLFDFTGTANGSEPMGSLISDGTYLYGMTYIGGAGNQGAIFKIKPDGTGYTNIYYFGYNVQDGAYPKGSLLYDGNYLYGMTEDGGANNLGTIFKIRTDGTGYFKILDFAGTNGSYPAGDLISDGTTYLYGMARRGGANDLGVVFKIKPDGTGYTDLLDFAGSSNGSYPFGSLTSDGIYFNAMTNTGGTSNDGTVFKIKPDGTGFSKLLDMYGANGYDPNGSLVYDGTYMYGMTYYGGSPVHGNIFKIRTDGTGYSDLFDFNGTNGDKPTANLVFDGGILYGMTSNGGTNSLGSLFKIQTDGTGFSKLLNFSGTANGSIPYGSLLSGGGVLYGMTFQGGTSNVGTIFRYCLGPNITVNASATTVCAGTSVTLSASGANSYSWNTSQTTSSIVVSPTTLSSYSVTGTNTNACTNTAVASVNVNALPVLSVSSQSVSCSGGNNGSAVVSVSSGVSPYTYSWMPNGQTTSAVTGLSQGTNTIQVTDANGCSAQQTVSITQPAALSLSTTVTNVLCFAGNNGSISTTASGGTFPYTYSILPGNQFTNLAAGNYSITITDANSCTATKTVSITQPAILSASVSVVANASCGNPDGSAAVTPSGGVAPYTYLWSNGEVIPNPNTFLSGTYSVTVTDNNGCTSSASVTITNSNPAPPSICLITVDSISKNNLIVWDKTTYVLGDTFLIYRDTANNAYGLIGKVPYDSLSWFIDTVRTLYAANGDPNVTSWRYKLAVKDSCGNTSAKSPYHQSIYMYYSAGTFQWSPGYEVELQPVPVPALQNYLLQRDNISNGNYVTIQTLSASSVIGTDPQYATYQATATWRVITSWTITCTPTIKNPVPNATNLNTSRSNIYKTNNPNAVSQTDFASQIIIYPNPTSGVFTLEVGRQTTAARQVEIYNVYGERVYSESIIGRQSSVIDLRAAPSGIYFLQLKTEQGIANKKIIINK